MGLFNTHSIFRLGKTIPTILGIVTITLHAYGSVSHLLLPENLKIFIMSELALFLLLCGGYLMNDIIDLPYDRINRPGTVYIGKLISQNAAVVLFVILFALSLTFAAAASQLVCAVIAAQMAALLFYNIFSKKMSYLKPFFITLLFVSMYPLSFAIAGGGIPGPRRDSIFIFPVWLYFTVLSYEFITDAKDWTGDSISGAVGFTGRFGADAMIRSGKIITVLALPIAFIPYFAGMCGIIYLS
ncbi:MAG: UbiA family prenyltransferase, partial [Spirochaetota bacterium]